jgi:sialidase-1
MSGYRIPIITCTSDGSLIALAEGRKDSLNDEGPKLLSIRRSTDGGQTWHPTSSARDNGGTEGLALGVVLTDYVRNITMIIYSYCPRVCADYATIVRKSYDNGLTWTEPWDISKQIGDIRFLGGPGYGLQKQHDPNKGRLLACGHHVSLSVDGVVCIYSDDHGVSWHMGGSISSIPFGQARAYHDFCPDENQVVELKDGSLLFSIRNQYQYHGPTRMFARSYDGGITMRLEDVYFAEKLPDPVCAAGMLYLEEYDILLHSNPFSKTDRINMTLSWSYDQGVTWNDSDRLQIWPGPSGYSCLTAIPTKPGYIALVFENGEVSEDYCEYISYISINLHPHLKD